MSKIIYTGIESSGKSLKMAMTVKEIAERNSKWFNESGIARKIYSNLKFSKDFENYVINTLKIPIVYWKNLDELITVEHADIFINEIRNYFDARN